MSAKHTPGPWTITDTGEAYRPFTIYSALKCVADVIASSREDVEPEDRANADAIAAVPEMIEALRQCITEPGAVCWRKREYAELRIKAISDLARATLAKAVRS